MTGESSRKKRQLPPGFLVDHPPDVPRRRVEDFYQRYVPKHLLRLMGADKITDVELGDYIERKITVLFADIRDFAKISERMTPKENFEFINRFLERIVPIIHEKGGIIDKFIGDAVMAQFPNSADQAVSAAIGMLSAVREMNKENRDFSPIGIGIGMNTGFAMLGAVGNIDRMDITIVGDSVNLASRLETATKQYGTPLLIGESTLNALERPGDFAIRFVDRLRVKGKERPQSVYEVYDNDPPELKRVKSESVGNFENALAHYHLKRVDRAMELFGECAGSAPDDNVVRFYLDRCERFLGGGQHEGTGELDHEVEWSDSFSIGIPQIDDQHMELLANINQVSKLVKEEKREGLAQGLDVLEECSLAHFSDEESLMDEYDYPFLDEQKKEHSRFIEYFSYLRQEIESQRHDRLYLMMKVDVFLVDWLLSHTTGIDKHFGRFVLMADPPLKTIDS